MQPTVQKLLTALRRFGPRSNWFLGTPLRATIAPVLPAGYILLIDYSNGRDWVTLHGGQPGEDWTSLATEVTDGRPTEQDLAAIDAALADRQLSRTEPWGIDLE